jgi:hypothetical protein
MARYDMGSLEHLPGERSEQVEKRNGMRDLRRGVMKDYVAWSDGACGPFNPGGTATYGAMVKDNSGNVLMEESRPAGWRLV